MKKRKTTLEVQAKTERRIEEQVRRCWLTKTANRKGLLIINTLSAHCERINN